MDELKPCPFCGGEAELKGDKACYGCFVMCTHCFAETDYSKNKKEAIEVWNRRVERDD